MYSKKKTQKLFGAEGGYAIVYYYDTNQNKSNPLHMQECMPTSSTTPSKSIRGLNSLKPYIDKKHKQNLIFSKCKTSRTATMPNLFTLHHPTHKKLHLIWSPSRTMYKGITNCATHTILQDKVQMLIENPFLQRISKSRSAHIPKTSTGIGREVRYRHFIQYLLRNGPKGNNGKHNSITWLQYLHRLQNGALNGRRRLHLQDMICRGNCNKSKQLPTSMLWSLITVRDNRV